MTRTDRPAGPASRRQLLGWAATAAALPSSGVLTGCAFGGSDDSPKAERGAKTANNPFGVGQNTSLEVVVFKGGYGDAYAKEGHGPLFEQAFPGVNTEITSAQRIATTIQPRFVGGNPPDVVDNEGEAMDVGALVQDGQLSDLTPLLDAPTVDDPGRKVRDILLPGTVESGTVDGTLYQLPYLNTLYGLWYDAAMFEAKGWQPPITWDDFVDLSKEIKSAGIDPFGLAGKNAVYYITNVILTSMIKLGGDTVRKDIDNLSPGAWRAPAVEEATHRWHEYAATYIDRNYMGQEHTVAQLRQVLGKLAFYPCGSWLENEMKKDTPKDFRFAVTAVPSLTAKDKLKADAYQVSPSEPFAVPAKAKNPAAGMEYIRQMLSRKGVQGFIERTGGSVSVVDATEGMDLPPGARSAADALGSASTLIAPFNYPKWYKELDTEINTAVGELVAGRARPKEFMDRLQGAADRVKKDPSVKKFRA
ncbi:N-acetylglucosamine/diacetylchitobiose ABC transporter substrate-binding protein [Streptomyces sp. NPDC091376]|uniref:N-acetylglucosamine/diacetylchitobiose ABC transporter substrate-binding protein n=1 Tax=Streptomyces sp. NPDC091376 TaxID=3365994 RepID=UPI0038096E12